MRAVAAVDRNHRSGAVLMSDRTLVQFIAERDKSASLTKKHVDHVAKPPTCRSLLRRAGTIPEATCQLYAAARIDSPWTALEPRQRCQKSFAITG